MAKKKTKLFFLLISLVLVFSFCLPFIASKYSNKNQIEEISEYTSKVVQNSTDNSKYLAITVSSTPESGSTSNPADEFYKLYGTFRQEQASFGSGINFYNEDKSDKDHSIFLKDFSGSIASSNLSLFFLGPTGSVEYKDHYKHRVYPFELMFPDQWDNRYLAYISKTHAYRLLESLGEPKKDDGTFIEEQYKSLLNKKINLDIDGTDCEYVIRNIYYEFNYYYEAMKEVFSDYILTSWHSPNKNALMAERRNIYFMNQYPYQNQYYMEYINKVYSNKLYDVSISKNNITKDFNDQKILDFYYSSLDNSNNGIFITLTIIYYLLLIVCLVLLMMFGFSFSLLSSLSLGICSFAPYFVFLVIFKITKSSTYFSKVAGINYFIGIVIMATTFIVWHFINKYVPGKRKKL